MKRKSLLMLTLVLILGLLVACGGSDSGGEESSDDGEEKVRIALLCDVAGSKVFVNELIDGLNEAAEKYDFEPIVAESADNAAFEDNARALVAEGVDLIIGGGWLAGDAINAMATEFPDDCEYAIIDSEVEAENVKCISYREQEGAYLIGVMAGLVTEDDENTFGSIHVNQGAGSWKWRYGLMEGVKTIKPDAEFIFNYVGDYNDPAGAKEFAIQQYEQGCAFINSAAASGDRGVFEAALEKGFYTIGQDIDWTTPDNPYIISSQIKDTKNTMLNLIDLFCGDSEWNHDNEYWGISEGTIGAIYVTHETDTPRPEVLTDEIIEHLRDVAEQIRTGELDLINMPTEEEYSN